MKHVKIKWVVLLASMGITSHAQETITASGGDISGSGGTVAYSIGQVVYTTHTAASGTVSQGVQHPYEIYTLGIQENELNIALSVFPNPATHHVTLQIQGYTNERLSYQLYDLLGKLVDNGQITARQTQINTANIASGTYLLKVVQPENKKIQSFKIIKN